MSANSNNSLLESYFFIESYSCYVTSQGKLLLAIFNVAHAVVILPLCIIILNYGFQQWRQESSTISHCDSFTYHMVSMELIGVLGCVFSLLGTCTGNQDVLFSAMNVFYFTWYGQVFFHILTCVERYLAVVHPVTYLSLRNERGVRIRNITIGCIWLLSIAGFAFVVFKYYIFLDVSLLIFSTIIILFCSLYILCVLIRPGPGGQVKVRERVDQSKQRALYTIVAILVILILRFTFGLVWAVLEILNDKNQCFMMICSVWVNLPSSLVLPLLFLQRTGKLHCCVKRKKKTVHLIRIS